MMKFEAFKSSMSGDVPPMDIPSTLTALWYAGKGDWERAHNIAQDIPTREGSWVHAYLHRMEGDQGNAHYWYNRAVKSMPASTLEEEWEAMVKAMLPSAK